MTERPLQRTVRLVPGQHLQLALPQAYTPPVVDDPSTLRTLTGSGGYPTGQPLRVELVALRAGTTDVQTHTDADCFHAVASCAYPQADLTLRVVVGATTRGPTLRP